MLSKFLRPDSPFDGPTSSDDGHPTSGLSDDEMPRRVNVKELIRHFNAVAEGVAKPTPLQSRSVSAAQAVAAVMADTAPIDTPPKSTDGLLARLTTTASFCVAEHCAASSSVQHNGAVSMPCLLNRPLPMKRTRPRSHQSVGAAQLRPKYLQTLKRQRGQRSPRSLYNPFKMYEPFKNDRSNNRIYLLEPEFEHLLPSPPRTPRRLSENISRSVDLGIDNGGSGVTTPPAYIPTANASLHNLRSHALNQEYKSKTTIAMNPKGVRIIVDIFFGEENPIPGMDRVITHLPPSRILSDLKARASPLTRDI